MTNSNTSIKYNGQVSVKIMQGERTISSSIYHNQGTTELFRFLATCLQGKLYENSRPCKIRLFTYTPDETDNSKLIWTDETCVSLPVMYSTNPVLSTDTEEVNGLPKPDNYSVTYTFRIPYSKIEGGSGGEVTIGKVALYSNINVTSLEKMSAYYLFKKKINDDQAEEWDPIVLDVRNSDYTLVIEWKLTISN